MLIGKLGLGLKKGTVLTAALMVGTKTGLLPGVRATFPADRHPLVGSLFGVGMGDEHWGVDGAYSSGASISPDFGRF